MAQGTPFRRPPRPPPGHFKVVGGGTLGSADIHTINVLIDAPKRVLILGSLLK